MFIAAQILHLALWLYASVWAKSARITAGLWKLTKLPLTLRNVIPFSLAQSCHLVLKPASDWDIAVSAGSMSALDHTVGQNPLGTRMSCERYKAIYELCAAHDVIIVEDDAYYYLQHNSHDEKADEEVSAVAGLELGPSFISIDQKGLVFRLDTVSKMLSPGFRLGWVTGPKHFIKAFEQVCYISCQMGCSMSIVCLGKLLAHWNTEGLEAQMKRVQMCLRLRCRSLLRACEAVQLRAPSMDLQTFKIEVNWKYNELHHWIWTVSLC
ncbi:Aromatic amino acid aminotransferase C56E4.03 [Durusdinium trenchii]|uniref:Aromatic amino acid aminotransferase C56E4.03 n=1 Tax=Durusdinium trenchii TaxID=1381693 RepID=A0ABP0SFM7_9DINO